MIYPIKLGALGLKQRLVCVCIHVIDGDRGKGEKMSERVWMGEKSEAPYNRANREKREHRRE